MSQAGGDKKFALKPFTKNNILYYYLPLESLVSYATLSVNVMNPSAITRVFPKRDVTNFLLIHTIAGTTLYLYSRPSINSAPGNKSLIYSLVGSTLFSFGSVLLWAILKSALPKESALLPTLAGLASGVALVKVTTDFFDHVDSSSAAAKK